MQVASRDAERIKTQDFWKLGNRKISRLHRIIAQCSAPPPSKNPLKIQNLFCAISHENQSLSQILRKLLQLQQFNMTSTDFFSLFHTAQKMKFPIKNFFSKYDQIRSFLWIWSHLLKKSLMENFIFCVVSRLFKDNK